MIAERDQLAVERDHLRLAYQNLQVELALLTKRLFDAKRERIDTAQLELELGAKLAALDALNRQLGLEPEDDTDEGAAGKNGAGGRRRKARPTGRRDLAALDLPVERIEIHDPAADADTTLISWEESSRLHWRRASWVRTVVARPIYKVEAPPAQPDMPRRNTATSSALRTSAEALAFPLILSERGELPCLRVE